MNQEWLHAIVRKLPRKMAAQFFLKVFAWKEIPLIAYVGAKVMDVSHDSLVIRIPLNRRTRNHLKSMYFGTLMIGADCAGGILAFLISLESKEPISLVFKDVNAVFLRRPEGDVYFTCDDGPQIRKLIANTLASGKRCEDTVKVRARVPSISQEEDVARFDLTLSLKKLSS